MEFIIAEVRDANRFSVSVRFRHNVAIARGSFRYSRALVQVECMCGEGWMSREHIWFLFRHKAFSPLELPV